MHNSFRLEKKYGERGRGWPRAKGHPRPPGGVSFQVPALFLKTGGVAILASAPPPSFSGKVRPRAGAFLEPSTFSVFYPISRRDTRQVPGPNGISRPISPGKRPPRTDSSPSGPENKSLNRKIKFVFGFSGNLPDGGPVGGGLRSAFRPGRTFSCGFQLHW